MVCLACLLPIFLIPLLNVLPRILDFFVKKFYGLFGWEYKPTARAPPSCPYRSANVPAKAPLDENANQMKGISEADAAPLSHKHSDGNALKTD